MRDGRSQFCFQYLDDLHALRANTPAANLTSTFAVYLALTEMAAVQFKTGGRDGIVASRQSVAEAAGVSLRTLDTVMKRLAKIGIVTLERRREGTTDLPSRYCLTGAMVARGVQREGFSLHPSRAGEPVQLEVDGKAKEKTEPIGFEEWIEHHCSLTGQSVPRLSKARAELARKYGELTGEGRSPEDMKLASIGAHADDWRRQNGKDYPRNVLVFSTIDELIDKGRKAKPQATQSYVRKGPRRAF